MYLKKFRLSNCESMNPPSVWIPRLVAIRSLQPTSWRLLSMGLMTWVYVPHKKPRSKVPSPCIPTPPKKKNPQKTQNKKQQVHSGWFQILQRNPWVGRDSLCKYCKELLYFILPPDLIFPLGAGMFPSDLACQSYGWYRLQKTCNPGCHPPHHASHPICWHS